MIWELRRGASISGPFTTESMLSMIRSGTIRRGREARRGPKCPWYPIEVHPEFRSTLDEVGPTLASMPEPEDEPERRMGDVLREAAIAAGVPIVELPPRVRSETRLEKLVAALRHAADWSSAHSEALRNWVGGALGVLCFVTMMGKLDACQAREKAEEARLESIKKQQQADFQATEELRAQKQLEEKEAAHQRRVRLRAIEDARPAPERAELAMPELKKTGDDARSGYCKAARLLDPIQGDDRRLPAVARAIALEKLRAIQELAKDQQEAEGRRDLMCGDGTSSDSCTCHGAHRGCCSHHGGVAGCGPVEKIGEVGCPAPEPIDPPPKHCMWKHCSD